MLKGFAGCGTFDAETRKVLHPLDCLSSNRAQFHYDRDEDLKPSEGQNTFLEFSGNSRIFWRSVH